MSDENNKLWGFSRRKLLGSMATVGAAGAIGGAGTMAFFSDEETFTNNTLTAGELDLKTAVSQHYVDWLPDTDTANGNVSPASPQETDDASMADSDPDLVLEAPSSGGGQTNTRPIELDISDSTGLFTGSLVNEVNGGVPLGGRETSLCTLEESGDGEFDPDDAEREIVQLTDVKPGDFGIIRFEVASCTNPAFLWATGAIEDRSEDGLTEPEAEDPDEDGPGGDTVELIDEVQLALVGGPVTNVVDSSPVSPGYTLRDLDGGQRIELEGDIAAPEGGGADGARDCFEGDTNYQASLVWWLPINHANEIQSDSVTFSLGMYAEQCRHNDGSGQFGNDGS